MSNLFVSALASHFSDHRSTCFPDAYSWKAPRTLPNKRTQSELSSIPQLLSCLHLASHRRPTICPMAKARSPSIIQNASPTTLSTQMVPKTRESQPQCPSNLRLTSSQVTTLPPLWSLYIGTLSSPNPATNCSTHHPQKEAHTPWSALKPYLGLTTSPLCSSHSNQPE